MPSTYLNEVYGQLNEEQLRAVNSNSNVVVVAGPGSGKTRIICIKAALLQAREIGVACISFGNATTDKIYTDLTKFGLRDLSSNMFIGTVHTFCLNHVMYPFSSYFKDKLPDKFGLASESQSLRALYQVLKQYPQFHNLDLVSGSGQEIRERVKKFYSGQFNQMRQEKVLGIGVQKDKLITEYELFLENNGLLDFEAIVAKSIDFIRSSEVVHRYIREKFPWFLIDEYQDLGGSLHALALTLVQDVGVKVLAVGDPDQMIYDFTGASITYFEELKTLPSFDNPIETKVCYRFGNRLVASSSIVIGRQLSYLGHESCSIGNISFHELPTLSEQCDWIVSALIPDLLGQGYLPESIAVLYRQRGSIPDELRRAIGDSNVNHHQVDFIDERDTNLPDSPIIRWIRECADWSVSYREKNTATLNLFPDLLNQYLDLLNSANQRPSDNDELDIEILLKNVLIKYSIPSMDATEWVKQFCRDLRVVRLLELAGNRSGELEDLADIQNIHFLNREIRDVVLQSQTGKVVLTTMHSSKGREFDVVILPGTQQNIMPWSGKSNEASSRRLFYVACTRARKDLHILYSELTEPIEMPWGEFKRCPKSTFIDELRANKL